MLNIRRKYDIFYNSMRKLERVKKYQKRGILKVKDREYICSGLTLALNYLRYFHDIN